jgi:hypothetical protein
MTGDSDQVALVAGLPPMAVPITVKIPDPMTMPTPSAVSETGPRVFLSACSGRSESEINLSMDFLAKIWRARVRSPAFWIYRILMIVCGREAKGAYENAAGGAEAPPVEWMLRLWLALRLAA